MIFAKFVCVRYFVNSPIVATCTPSFVLARLVTMFTQKITFSAIFHGNSMAVSGSSTKLASLERSRSMHSLPRVCDVSLVWGRHYNPVTAAARLATSPTARLVISLSRQQTHRATPGANILQSRRLMVLLVASSLHLVLETTSPYSIWVVQTPPLLNQKRCGLI